MATRTISNVGGNYSATSAWVEGAVPAASDDIVATATSGNLTLDANCAARSADFTNYVGTLTHNAAVTWTLGTSTSNGTLSLKFVAGMTYTLGSATTSAIVWASTSGAQEQITTAGKLIGLATFNGVGGSWIFQDAFNDGTSTLTLTAGTLNTNGKTVTVGALSSTVANARTLTLGTSTITLSGSGWNITAAGSLIVSGGSSTINLTATDSPLFQHGSLSGSNGGVYGTVNYSGFTTTGAAQFSCNAATTIINFSVQPGATTNNTNLIIASAATITGTLTLGGNTIQGNNRLLVQSSTVGTQRVITATGAAVVINGDVDFQDIAINGSPSWTNASNAFVGDAQGNGTLITTNKTTPVDQYRIGAGGNWSDATHWSTSSGGSANGRAPLPQDNVHVDANATGTVTADMPRLGANIDFSGYTGIYDHSSANRSCFGNIAFAAGMTVNNTGTGGILQLSGRGVQTITTAGTVLAVGFNIFAPGGSYTLQDNVTISQAATQITVSKGTFNDNGKSVTATNATSSRIFQDSGATAVTLSGIWTAAVTSSGAWFVGTAAVNASAARFILNAASANSRTFQGGGGSYGTLTYTVAGSTGALVITGANTFGTINFSDASNARTLTLPASTITTVTTFNVFGSSGKLVTLNSSTGGTAATLKSAAGTGQIIGTDYLSVQDLTFSGTAGSTTFYAGANSTNVSNNTGIIFAAPVVSVAETGNGVDAISLVGLGTMGNIGDTANGVDHVSSMSANVSASETAAFVDVTAQIAFAAADSAAVADTPIVGPNVFDNTTFMDITSGVGVSVGETSSFDEMARLFDTLTLYETTSVSDALLLQPNVAASDTALLVESLNLSLSANEFANLSDQLTRINLNCSENVSSVDIAAIISIVLGENVIAADVANLYLNIIQSETISTADFAQYHVLQLVQAYLSSRDGKGELRSRDGDESLVMA